MDFSKMEGFEEFFSDGVVDPLLANPGFRVNAGKYKQLAHRVFVLYEPDGNDGPAQPNTAAAPEKGRPPPSGANADFDIVLIHGMGSDEFRCWTNTKNILWPAVFLPQDFPSARVLAVGYAHALWNWKGDDGDDDEGGASGEGDAKRPQLKRERPAAAGSPASASAEISNGSGASKKAAMGQTKEAGGTSHEAAPALPSSSPLDAVWSHLSSLDVSWPSFMSRHGPHAEDSSQELPGKLPSPPPPHQPQQRQQACVDPEPSLTAPAADALLTTTEVGDAVNGNTVVSQGKRGALHTLLMRDTEAVVDMFGSTADNDDDDGNGDGHSSSKHDARQLQSFRLVAADLADRLVASGVGTGQRPVVIIVHSMGGLVAKQMIVSLFQLISLTPRRRYLGRPTTTTTTTTATQDPLEGNGADTSGDALAQADAFLRSIRGIAFYGTPHFGSSLASVITGATRYYSNLGGLTPANNVSQMGDHNRGALSLLNDRFMEAVSRLDERCPTAASGREIGPVGFAPPSPPEISIISFGETEKLHGLLRIVEPESANPAPDDPRFPFYLIKGDHSHICRPPAKTSPAYAMLYGFLDRLQQRGSLLPVVQSSHESTIAATIAAGAGAAVLPVESSHSTALRAFEDAAWRELLGPVQHSSRTALTGTAALTSSSSSAVEMLVLMRALDAAQGTLRATVARFFGRVVPPELDGIFLLGADMREFVDRGTAVLAALEEEAAAHGRTVDAHQQDHGRREPTLGASCSFSQAFVIPARLLLFWTDRATNLIRSFERAQAEVMAAQAAGDASAVAAGGGGGSGLSPGAAREMEAFEGEVSVLQGEWEGFRRYLSVAIRHETLSRTRRNAQPAMTTLRENSKAPPPPPLTPLDHPDIEAVGNERVSIMLFARAVRSLVAIALRDGECLSNLVGQFINSSLGVLTAGDSAAASSPDAPPSHKGPSDPFYGLVDRDAFVTILAESLELYDGGTNGRGEPGVLPNTSRMAAVVDATSAITGSEQQVLEVLPQLRATSSFLLACYHLFLGDCRPDRATTARVLLESTRVSLEDCGRTFARLERNERRKKGTSRNRNNGNSRDDSTSPSSSSSSVAALPAACDRWQQVCILTEAFSLLAQSLVCVTYLREIEALAPSAATAPRDARAGEEELSELLEGLSASVLRAQAAYRRTEYAVAGKHDDTKRPFAPGSDNTITNSKKNTAGAAMAGDGDGAAASSSDAAAKGKALREAVAGVLSDLDAFMGGSQRVVGDKPPPGGGAAATSTSGGGGGAVVAPSEPSGAAAAVGAWRAPQRPAWLTRRSRRGSLPKLMLNSLLNAWEAVRRGGEAPHTPRFFASNAFVFWWGVEEYAALVGHVLGGGAGAEGGGGPPQHDRPHLSVGGGVRCGPGPYRGAQSEFLARRAEAARWQQQPQQQKLVESGSTVDLPLTTTTVATAATPEAVSGRSMRRRQREQFAAAHDEIKCGWATASGYVAAVEARQRVAEGLRTELKTLLTPTATTVAEPSDVSTPVVDQTAVLLRVGALLSVPVPTALGDAARLDGGNPSVRLLLGHWHFLNLRGSTDAAFSYQQVLRADRDPGSRLFQSAATGLGWVHLHRLGTSVSISGGGGGAGRRLEWERLANGVADGLADVPPPRPRATGLLDPVSQRAAPPGFPALCAEAADLLLFNDGLSPRAVGRATGLRPRAAAVATSSGTGCGGDAVVAHRLSLADGYFRTVLEADPANVGALCGLGRLRSLVAATEGNINSSSSGSGNGFQAHHHHHHHHHHPSSSSLSEARAYFTAAALAGEPACLAAPLTAGTMLVPTFASYAAHWLGDLAAPPALGDGDTRLIAAAPYRQDDGRAGAVARSQQWYCRAVHLDPLNDWALTSLAIGVATAAQLAAADPVPPGARASGRIAADMARAVAMMEVALRLNPTNMWALWGVARHGVCGGRRDECLRQLRALLTRRHRMGRLI